MQFWTLIGVAAIVAGLILAARYGLRAYRGYIADPVDTIPEAKAVGLNAGKAGLGLLIFGIGIKLIVGMFLLLAVFAVTTPAHAIVDCHQYLGCREVGAKPPLVSNAKIARHIASRPNVMIDKPVRSHGRKVVKIRRGLFGEFLSPMHDYRAPLEACGYRVEYGSFWSPSGGADAEIAHSMAVFGALNSNSRRVFTIDAPIWSGGHKARHSRTANFPTVAHPRVYGAVNVPIGGGHIGAPNEAKRHILSLLGCGKRARHAAVRR